MTISEIREKQNPNAAGVYDTQQFWLSEIAAQLAELNETLQAITLPGALAITTRSGDALVIYKQET